VGKYSRLLEEYGIDHWVTREAAVNGKVEALNGSFQKELIRQVEFADRDDALRQIGAWVRHYNFQRTHQALGGLLVPGDRFMGCVEETLRRIEEGQGGNPLDIISPQNRALELFRVISEGGSPKVYLMGQKILG
ncbi:MAG: transposase, partial [Desulfobacteraceae bacterium]|nr:transposase [Desulfobacteraceae bacterium]